MFEFVAHQKPNARQETENGFNVHIGGSYSNSHSYRFKKYIFVVVQSASFKENFCYHTTPSVVTPKLRRYLVENIYLANQYESLPPPQAIL